jgi:hypothetical protein
MAKSFDKLVRWATAKAIGIRQPSLLKPEEQE